MKREAIGKIVDALREILNGQRYVSGVISRPMIAKSKHGEEPCGANRVRELSERELEVLELIGKGHLIREIAEKLYLSRKHDQLSAPLLY